MKAIYVIPAAISLLFPALATAELKWEQTMVELNPGISDKQAVGHFKYENTGTQPVRFKSVKASCGCTAAQTQKEEVAPGEKGEITATFTIGDRVGQQVKTVSVDTDPGGMTTLTLKTNIPQALELTPNFVFWQAGEKPEPKVVTAKVGKDVPIKNLEVVSMNKQFDAKVEKGAAAGQFRIMISPKETTIPASAAVTVKTDFPKDAPKTYYITARVAGPAPAAVNNPPAPVVAASPNPGS